MTHAELVQVAARWLRSAKYVVVTEVGGNTAHGEIPDAIGWRGYRSTLIECKVSRADFLADRAKPFRKDATLGMGLRRFYLAPKGLLTLSDVEASGWGLLETKGTKVFVVRQSSMFRTRSLRSELQLMYTTLQRVQYRINRPLHEIVNWESRNLVVDVLPMIEEYGTEPIDPL